MADAVRIPSGLPVGELRGRCEQSVPLTAAQFDTVCFAVFDYSFVSLVVKSMAEMPGAK
jgi:hypothetical protein